ncbi:MAG: cysteine desulfurase [Elusimicrobia bacterium]|nr:cysteine desulfurase [Elusimicrobiota bacterium]
MTASTPYVYLDHNATTPVRPEVLEAMLPFLKGEFGNPNSVHAAGQRARRAVERAREQAAALIGCAPAEVVFTGGGSEADSAALCGAAQAAWNASAGRRRHLVVSTVEHEAVLGAARQLAARGFELSWVGVDAACRVDPAAVAAALRPETCLVSVMAANNEVGTLQPVRELAALCRSRGVLFHCDAVQAAGKVPLEFSAAGVDLMALSGHKLNAPKGVGALAVRRGTPLVALVSGHQEKNRRGGTENVAGIVAFGAACELAQREQAAHNKELIALRDRLEAGVLRNPGTRRTVEAADRLPGTSHFCVSAVDGHSLVVALDLEGVCVSSGPACSAGATELSHVLKAVGVAEEWGKGALRVSLGWGSTGADVDRLLSVLPGCLERLRLASKAGVS